MKHVKYFEDFFNQYNALSLAQGPERKRLVSEVIQVAEIAVNTPVSPINVSNH